jgi:serine/threonine protein kinase/outer membrane protein OmpA-like peptidoglycan-associated protein
MHAESARRRGAEWIASKEGRFVVQIGSCICSTASEDTCRVIDARGIIGNYIVERELGRGGMGVVYEAKHRVLGRPAAIKLLLANASEDRGRVERFFNEARAAMAIDHPGVVKIYDVGIAADDRPYIAMELLDGIALASLVSPAGLPIRQAVDYACQIAAALAAAHDAGVIHRDLKPENIIISRDRSRATVVDFGIAKLAHQATVRTATGALVGTPLYMSPEQCEGLRELDARSDLYAFGCVIFAMLTGRPPFFEGGTGGLIGMHLHVAPPPLRSRCANASDALERVVSVLLAKSPDARFRTARATLAALQAPEVRGLATNASGVPATADMVEGNRSVQPWAATPSVPASRDARTMATGIAPANSSMSSASGPMPHSSMPSAPNPSGSLAPTAFGVPASRDAWTQVTGADFRDPRTAAVQAQGTPSPSSVVPYSSGMPSPAGTPYASPGGTPHVSSSAVHPASNAPSHAGAHSHVGAPSHAGSAHAITPPTHGPSPYAPPTHGAHPQSRRRLIIAIVASSALTALIAIGASRGCGGSGGAIDAGVAVGSGSGTNIAIGHGSSAGSSTLDTIGRVDVDAAVIATNDTNDPKTTQPTTSTQRTTQPTTQPKTTQKAETKGTPKTGTKGTQTAPKVTQKTEPKGTTPTDSVQIDPNGSALPGARPRNHVPGAGLANLTDEEQEKAQAREPAVRHEIHDHFLFAKGDHQATLGQRALDRVAANHRLDPTRRIVITGHAEQDEPGVLDALAGARANTAYTHLINRGVSRNVLVMSSGRYIDPVTPNGANRRVNIDFE